MLVVVWTVEHNISNSPYDGQILSEWTVSRHTILEHQLSQWTYWPRQSYGPFQNMLAIATINSLEFHPLYLVEALLESIAKIPILQM